MTDRYPNHPGHRGVETSVEAAEALAPCLGNLQKRTLATIRAAGDAGLTAHETTHAIGFVREAIQPRLSELRRKRLIVDSGRRRKNLSGKKAIVWIATPQADTEPPVSGSPVQTCPMDMVARYD
jgi:hypothetical protein